MKGKNDNEIVIGEGVRIEGNLKNYPAQQSLVLTICRNTEPTTRTSIEIDIVDKADLMKLSNFFRELSNKAY